MLNFDRLLLECNVCQELLLPESLQSIGASAFEGMSALKSIVIPDAVTALGSSAFKNCTDLATAKLSANLSTISNSTFYSCTSLEGITIPDKVAEIYGSAFYNCTSLGYANLGKGLKKINDYVFSGCSSLPALVVPANVTNIGNYVFNDCTSLADVTLADGNPDDYLYLGNATYQYREVSWGPLRTKYKGLFRDCPVERLHLGRWLIYDTNDAEESPFSYITTLKDLEIGETCGMIGKYAFTGCSSLNPLFVPSNIESIGEWTFKECTSLDNVTLSEGLISLGEQAFFGSTSLPEITIPESLPALSDETFRGCTALAKANMGSSLETIGPRVFMDCSALTDAAIPESVYALGVESFANCTSLPAIVIPDGMLRNVGSKSFNGCTGATYISLGKRVTSIGDDAFGGCDNIGYIKSYNTVPPEGVTGFSEEIEKTATLFVPEASIDMYKYSLTWENFFNIKPLANDVLVKSITVTPGEVSIHLKEQVQLTATVSNDDASNKEVAWSSSDEAIATVDDNGVVTAVSVGAVTITAEATDGSHIKGYSVVTVLPTLVESITIEEQDIRLKVDKKIQLTAVVGPDDATDKTIVWSSSNSRIADVDANGLVTAGRYYSGDVTITATAADGSGVSASCLITVYDRTQGDTNDDDKVNVTDVMTIYNYIYSNPINGFDRLAADVNSDNSINGKDMTEVVNIILNMPYTSPEVNGIDKEPSAGDCLVAANISINGGGSNTMDISIENSHAYSALQFDIILPEGISLDKLSRGNSDFNQGLNWKQVENNVVRVVLSPYWNTVTKLENQSLVTLSLTADQAFKKGDLAIHNIVAVDPECNEYTLASAGGHIEETSGIGNVMTGEATVTAVANGVEISVPCASVISIYRADGVMVDSFTMDSGKAFKPLAAGVYIVTVNNNPFKLYVR